MNDPLRSDRPPTTLDVAEHDRDARVEDLLLAGLDHYFAGQYELAINVWTRVLFIDRGHARARAYIERARGALSERQREAEELLHGGAAAFARGEVDAARRLLTSAVERGAGNEEALALLDRLDRLNGPPAQHEPTVLPPLRVRVDGQQVPAPSAIEERSRLAWVGAGLVAGLVLAAAAVAFLFARGEWPALERNTSIGLTPPSTAEPLIVPSAGDVALARARALHAKGRLHDALAALGAIRLSDARHAEAEDLRAHIQRTLLEAGRAPLTLPPSVTRPATAPGGSPIRR